MQGFVELVRFGDDAQAKSKYPKQRNFLPPSMYTTNSNIHTIY